MGVGFGEEEEVRVGVGVGCDGWGGVARWGFWRVRQDLCVPAVCGCAAAQSFDAPAAQFPAEDFAHAGFGVAEGEVADAGVEVDGAGMCGIEPQAGCGQGWQGEQSGFFRDVAAGEHGVEGSPGLMDSVLTGCAPECRDEVGGSRWLGGGVGRRKVSLQGGDVRVAEDVGVLVLG